MISLIASNNKMFLQFCLALTMINEGLTKKVNTMMKLIYIIYIIYQEETVGYNLKIY